MIQGLFSGMGMTALLIGSSHLCYSTEGESQQEALFLSATCFEAGTVGRIQYFITPNVWGSDFTLNCVNCFSALHGRINKIIGASGLQECVDGSF